MSVHQKAPVPDVIERATGRKAEVALVLGSGLSSMAAHLTGGEAVPFSAVEGMPISTVAGHEGRLYAGDVEGVPTLVFAGRVHLYEGFSIEETTYPIRAAIGAGCRTVILTNAAGAINRELEVGAPCMISDHINLTGRSPLLGSNDDAVGPRFLDQSAVYSPELRAAARAADPSVPEGVYAGLLGPTYETPAEVRMLRTLGADLVGMSTVLEAIAARYLGARVAGMSLVSNQAAGLSDSPLSHEEIAAAAARAGERIAPLLRALVAAS